MSSEDSIEQPEGHGPRGTDLIDPRTILERLRKRTGLLVEVVGGPMDGARCHGTRCLTLGRTDDNDLALAFDPSVSSRHARIVVEDGQHWLEDLGSTNGTYLEAGRVTGRVAIEPGASFVVGRTTIELCSA